MSPITKLLGLLSLVSLFTSLSPVQAQTVQSVASAATPSSSPTSTPSPVPQKDFRELGGQLLRYLHLAKPDSLQPNQNQSDNNHPKQPKLLFACIPGIGYTLTTGLTAVVSNNLSFYLGDHQKTYLSSITTNAEFSLFDHQIIVPIESNIWSNNNDLNWLGDYRYLRFPSNTYGLGPYSSQYNAQLVDYSYLRFYQECLKKISQHQFLGIGYNLDYHYNINPLSAGDFQAYNQQATATTSSGLLLHYLYDGRLNVNTPEPGHYISLTYRSNLTALGSNTDWQSLQIDLRKYIQLSPHSSNILALWSYTWLTFGGKVPYFELPSTGWDTYSSIGRGYIQGRLRGGNLVYLEAEYRFGITRNGLIGGVVFVNAQSVTNPGNYQFQTVLPGEGVGLRFKVNKHSVVNFCVDYAIGNQGSKGFFFNICEYF